jgi:dephospho-CoA kinase
MSESGPLFGLTGGVASGKSTVARMFETLSARIIDADRIGHECLLRSEPTYAEIVRTFGSSILDASGAIDRLRLGAIVFSDAEKLRRLDAIVHPRIIARVAELARRYHADNPGTVILVDAALIFETGIGEHFKKVLVAWCRPEQQLERLIAKTGLSQAEAERRIAAQIPVEEKRRRADFVINCSGSLEQTRTQVEVVYAELQRLAA